RSPRRRPALRRSSVPVSVSPISPGAPRSGPAADNGAPRYSNVTRPGRAWGLAPPGWPLIVSPVSGPTPRNSADRAPENEERGATGGRDAGRHAAFEIGRAAGREGGSVAGDA